jgi:hypothetical protein
MIAGFGLPRQRHIRAKCELFEFQRTRISDGSGGARTHDQRVKSEILTLSASRTPQRQAARYGRPMPRRKMFDPLMAATKARWYVVRSMHGSILKAQPMPAGANVKRAFALAIVLDR